MSNTSAKSQPKSISEAQPETASLASVSRLDDLDVEAGLARARSRNSSRVGGEPAGLGGDQARARTTWCRRSWPAQTCSASMRALDGRLRQPAAGRDALAEADDAREGVDHLEAAPRGARDQQPAVVGAEIERGVGAAWAAGHGGSPSNSGAAGGSRSRAGGSAEATGAQRVGRTWRLAFPQLVFGGAQLGGAVLVLATLHHRLRRPVSAPRGLRASFWLSLRCTLSARGRG